MGTYRDGIAAVIAFISLIFIGISIMDARFQQTHAPSVGYRVQRWARKNAILSSALLLVFAMLMTHFLANPIGT